MRRRVPSLAPTGPFMGVGPREMHSSASTGLITFSMCLSRTVRLCKSRDEPVTASTRDYSVFAPMLVSTPELAWFEPRAVHA